VFLKGCRIRQLPGKKQSLSITPFCLQGCGRTSAVLPQRRLLPSWTDGVRWLRSLSKTRRKPNTTRRACRLSLALTLDTPRISVTCIAVSKAHVLTERCAPTIKGGADLQRYRSPLAIPQPYDPTPWSMIHCQPNPCLLGPILSGAISNVAQGSRVDMVPTRMACLFWKQPQMELLATDTIPVSAGRSRSELVQETLRPGPLVSVNFVLRQVKKSHDACGSRPGRRRFPCLPT
jgi:hypothetical protein